MKRHFLFHVAKIYFSCKAEEDKRLLNEDNILSECLIFLPSVLADLESGGLRGQILYCPFDIGGKIRSNT